MSGERSCPACNQVHGTGCGGWLHPSAEHRSLLLCNWCGRYYRHPNPGEGLAPIRIDIEAFRTARERLRKELAP